jgi:periplasmic protein CpxP/Spy
VIPTLVRHHKERSMNKFRRITLATLAGGVAAGIGFKAFANGRRHGHGPIDPANLDKHLDRMLKHLYVEIDATEAQKQQLTPIAKAAVKDLLPLREQARAARQRGIELLAGDRVDRGALEALRGEQIGLADQASRRLSQALADAAEVLTPEQRKNIAQRLQRRMRG